MTLYLRKRSNNDGFACVFGASGGRPEPPAPVCAFFSTCASASSSVSAN